MKFKIILSLLIVISHGCYSQKNLKMNIPQISDSVEKFELSNLSNVIMAKMITADPKNTRVAINENLYEIRDNSNEILVSYSKGPEKNSFFSGYDYSQNPLIGIYKEFYPNNSIKVKGIYCWFGFKIGIWYNYSEDGKLISIDDYDKGFDYSIDEIFQYCETNNIPLEKKESGLRTQISKYKTQDQKCYWFIQYPDYRKHCFINIQIDALTGKVVSTKEIQFPEYKEDSNRNK